MIGALCLPLAFAGIAGALPHSVSQQQREIGIRVALGAAPADIRRAVVGRGLRIVVVALAAGVIGGIAAGRMISALLFGVGVIDGRTVAAVASLVLAVALGAMIGPARRASRVNPIDALQRQ